ncbi:MAG: hypothetical protein MUE81_10275 [Thermoflexibacter sp.]|jgi:hypothetical protein|nr:hypothetical protein [Thermoflexibacter sp.]
MNQHKFTPPKPVIRIWHHHRVFDKTDYHNATITKKPILEGHWVCEVSSFVEEDRLFISEKKLENSDFYKKSPLLLEYVANEETRDFFEQVLYVPRWFIIFKNEGTLWLRLVKSDPIMHGYPARESYELCPLLLHTPVRILINSKTWHSFSQRHATQYYECDFIYEYLGDFSTFEINTDTYFVKQELKDIKTIDLRKRLY